MARTWIACALAALVCAAVPAAAQDWPAKPVKLIVPFPPGGSVDPLARLLGAKLDDALKQQFIVENKPGASGSIGTAFAAKSRARRLHLRVRVRHARGQPVADPELPFDTAKDLAPVMLVGTAPMAIATQPAKPYKTFADVVAAAKAKPDTVTFGSIGNGTLGHLTMMLVQQAGGFKLMHVPYKGGGPMTQDMIGGQIDLGVGSVAVLAPHVKGGKLRAIAVTGDKRSAAMPDVPTLAEQGFPGFSALAWWGIFAPAGTPKPILDKFHAELVKALEHADVRKTLVETLGMDLVVSSPEDAAEIPARRDGALGQGRQRQQHQARLTRASGQPPPRWVGIVLLLIIATIFGSNHIAARVAFEHGTNVTTAVVVRSAGTALFVLALLLFSGVSLRVERKGRALVVGLLLTIQSYCLYSAVARIPVALALLAFNTHPLALSLLSWASGGERPRPRVLAAMPIALAGLALALDVLGEAATSPGAGRRSARACCGRAERRFPSPRRCCSLRAGWAPWTAACAAFSP